MDLIFATHNDGKIKEIRSLLSGKARVFSLGELNLNEEIDEPFLTLEENAMHKAKEIFRRTGKACFADDTGLEVHSLGGKPGVLSARYAGEAKDPVTNMEKLLLEMKNSKDRSARFRTIIAFTDGKKEMIFEGIVNGKISKEKKGNKGFGYDPVFIPENETRTFAEMEPEEKNKFSHRAKAVRDFIYWLRIIL